MKVIVDSLVAEGVTVQLEHDPEETSWENHGWISIVRDADGTEIVRDEVFQHNRHYRNMSESAGAIVETVTQALEDPPKNGFERADSDGAAAA